MTNETKKFKTFRPVPGLEHDLQVLDLVARVLRMNQAGQRYRVFPRSSGDGFVCVQLRDGRLYNLTLQEVDKP